MLAPWCAAEHWTRWTDKDGKRFARVSGRQRCPTKYLLNPFWLASNDYEQQLEDAPWFLPGAPDWWRRLRWSLRNPLQNANLFLFGVADRNYTVEVIEGHPDPLTIQRDDVNETGWQRAKLTLDDGSVRWWSSYSDDKVVRNFGHQPSGLFEIKYIWK